jgi:hypothetical protein
MFTAHPPRLLLKERHTANGSRKILQNWDQADSFAHQESGITNQVMASDLLAKLLSPPLPACAIGLEKDAATAVQLERARGSFVIRRAASMPLSDDLIQPSFDQQNISDPAELAGALSDLLTSAGLLRQRKWSVSLPENATRTAILTMEATGSTREQDEMLEWKIERTFGAPLSELRIAREALPLDARKQKRHLATAVRLSVMSEYESVFAALGCQAGLILPRHVGEEQWLRNGDRGDSLLLSSHDEGFTAVLLRDNRPFVMRSVFCETEGCDDELHRVLLFYRDRADANSEGAPAAIARLLVLGEQLDRRRVAEIAQETLGTGLRALDASEVGLHIPGRDIKFDTIAGPAGLAKMAW